MESTKTQDWRVVDAKSDPNGTFVYTFDHINQNRGKLLSIKMRVGPNQTPLKVGDRVNIDARIKIIAELQ